MDMNLVIKVADFGLAQSLDTSKEYFRQDNDSAIKLPIKWLAPESINDGVFSEKSDVVSINCLSSRFSNSVSMGAQCIYSCTEWNRKHSLHTNLGYHKTT